MSHPRNSIGRTITERSHVAANPNAFTIDAECAGAGTFDWQQFNRLSGPAVAQAVRSLPNNNSCSCSWLSTCRCWANAFANSGKAELVVWLGNLSHFNNVQEIARGVAWWKAQNPHRQTVGVKPMVSVLALDDEMPHEGTWYRSGDLIQARPAVYSEDCETLPSVWLALTQSTVAYEVDAQMSEWRSTGVADVSPLANPGTVWLTRSRVKDATVAGMALWRLDVVKSTTRPASAMASIGSIESGICLGIRHRDNRLSTWCVNNKISTTVFNTLQNNPTKLKDVLPSAIGVQLANVGSIRRDELIGGEALWNTVYCHHVQKQLAKEDNTGSVRPWLIANDWLFDYSTDLLPGVVAGGKKLNWSRWITAQVFLHVLALCLFFLVIAAGKPIVTGAFSTLDSIACPGCRYGLFVTALSSLVNHPHNIPRADIVRWNDLIRSGDEQLCEEISAATGQPMTEGCRKDPWNYFKESEHSRGSLHWSITGLQKGNLKTYSDVFAAPLIEEAGKTLCHSAGVPLFGVTFGVMEFLGAAAQETFVQENMEKFLKARLPALGLHVLMAYKVNGLHFSNFVLSTLTHAIFNAWASSTRVIDNVQSYSNVAAAEEEVWGDADKDSNKVLFCESLHVAGSCVDKFGNSWITNGKVRLLLVNKMSSATIEKTAIFRQLINAASRATIQVDLVKAYRDISHAYNRGDTVVLKEIKYVMDSLEKSNIGRTIKSIIKLPGLVAWFAVTLDDTIDKFIGYDNVDTVLSYVEPVVGNVSHITQPINEFIINKTDSYINVTKPYVDQIYNSTTNVINYLHVPLVDDIIEVGSNLIKLSIYNGTDVGSVLDLSTPMRGTGALVLLQHLYVALDPLLPSVSYDFSLDFVKRDYDWNVNISSIDMSIRKNLWYEDKVHMFTNYTKFDFSREMCLFNSLSSNASISVADKTLTVSMSMTNLSLVYPSNLSVVSYSRSMNVSSGINRSALRIGKSVQHSTSYGSLNGSDVLIIKNFRSIAKTANFEYTHVMAFITVVSVFTNDKFWTLMYHIHDALFPQVDTNRTFDWAYSESMQSKISIMNWLKVLFCVLALTQHKFVWLSIKVVKECCINMMKTQVDPKDILVKKLKKKSSSEQLIDDNAISTMTDFEVDPWWSSNEAPTFAEPKLVDPTVIPQEEWVDDGAVDEETEDSTRDESEGEDDDLDIKKGRHRDAQTDTNSVGEQAVSDVECGSEGGVAEGDSTQSDDQD